MTTLLGVSSADGLTPVNVYADPTTHRLLVDIPGGSGDVVGPGSSTDNAVVRFEGTTGKLIQNSVVIIADTTGAITGTQSVQIGVAGSATGTLLMTGTTSGIVTIKTADAAGTWTMTLPTTDGDSGQFLQTNGSGVTTWASASASSAIEIGVTTITGGTTTRILYDNAGVVGEYTLTGTGTVVAMQTAPTFVTSITTPSVLATANDSGAIGASGTAFADLFLASGGIINWNAGNATITQSAGLLTTNVPVTITGVATADGFAPTSTTATGNRMYLPAANTIGFAINGTGELRLTGTALAPLANEGLDLGTSALAFNDAYLASDGVIQFGTGGTANFIVHDAAGGAIQIGSGAADGRLESQGNFDLVLATGNSTTGTITIADGANGNITVAPNGTGLLSVTGGGIQLTENAPIRYDAASSADGTYSGTTRAGTAGATLAFGDLVYLASADSRWELADADAATTSDRFLGMCVLAAASDGDPTTILLTGFIRADAAFPAMTIGSAMYVGETAGDIQVAIPTGADNVIRRVGYAWTADELYFNPSMDSQITVA